MNNKSPAITGRLSTGTNLCNLELSAVLTGLDQDENKGFHWRGTVARL